MDLMCAITFYVLVVASMYKLVPETHDRPG